MKTIAVFDSGLGGLTVLRALRRELPGVRYIYLGDTARTPYGSKGESTVRRYTFECAEFLEQFSPDGYVVACNTASAVALTDLSEKYSVPVIGPVEPVVQVASSRTRSGKVGVIGTSATMASGVFTKALLDKSSAFQVYQQACPLFVPLVEQGMFSGSIVESVMEHYLAGLKEKEIDTLVLGCTHYPFLRVAIDQYFEGEVELVECCEAITVSVKALFEETENENSSAGSIEYYVTDELSRFSSLAESIMKDGAEVHRAVL